MLLCWKQFCHFFRNGVEWIKLNFKKLVSALSLPVLTIAQTQKCKKLRIPSLAGIHRAPYKQTLRKQGEPQLNHPSAALSVCRLQVFCLSGGAAASAAHCFPQIHAACVIIIRAYNGTTPSPSLRPPC